MFVLDINQKMQKKRWSSLFIKGIINWVVSDKEPISIAVLVHSTHIKKNLGMGKRHEDFLRRITFFTYFG